MQQRVLLQRHLDSQRGIQIAPAALPCATLTQKLEVRHLLCEFAKLVFREMKAYPSYSLRYVLANEVSPSNLPGPGRHSTNGQGFEGPQTSPLTRCPRQRKVFLLP